MTAIHTRVLGGQDTPTGTASVNTAHAHIMYTHTLTLTHMQRVPSLSHSDMYCMHLLRFDNKYSDTPELWSLGISL